MVNAIWNVTLYFVLMEPADNPHLLYTVTYICMGVLRYEGTVQWQSLGPNVKALNMMWAVTGSKWSAMKRGVSWDHFGWLKTGCTAAFWVIWRGLILLAGRPTKSSLEQCSLCNFVFRFMTQSNRITIKLQNCIRECNLSIIVWSDPMLHVYLLMERSKGWLGYTVHRFHDMCLVRMWYWSDGTEWSLHDVKWPTTIAMLLWQH